MNNKFLKPYEPAATEQRIYELWEESGFFNPDNLPGERTKPFTVVLPPVNVTGVLHLGHAYEDSLQDAMIRFERMRGKKALFIPGTDSAAIATQARVEKNIQKEEKKSRHDLGREELVRRITEFAKASENTILSQVRRMGASLDWSRYAYTLDESRNRAVYEAFKRMYDAGLIYRGNRIVNWDPKGQTTISDDEIVYEERQTKLYTFKYSKDFPIAIATTRPETKVGDTAVAVHPDDKRYKQFIGNEYEMTFCDVPIKVKIVADESVEKDFGTGALGVTPAHSMADWEIADRHDLPRPQVINEYAKMTVNGRLNGKKTTEARELVVLWLKEEGLLEKEEDSEQNVATAERTGGIVEPLPKLQWWVDVSKEVEFPTGETMSLKDWMRHAVESGNVEMSQEGFRNIYMNWIINLRDWCISRQIWFGHRIPVWYCGNPNMKRMGFAGDIVPQVFEGKISTWRLRDHGFKANDEVAFEDSSTKKIFGYGTMTTVEKTTVGEIDLQDRKHYATYKNHDELIAAFKRHNPHKKVDMNTPVWMYVYTFDKNIKKGACGSIIASTESPAACPSCGGTNLIQDEDVLDTWFSSALWTFSTLGWPEDTEDLNTYHPTSFMSPGYEIINLWVSRMIMMSGFLLGEKPFDTVLIHGLVRAADGRKFSKSLNNGVDPLDMIDKYGADALRMGLLAGGAIGADIRFDEQRIKAYKHFANKLWNITRFVLTNTENYTFNSDTVLEKEDVKRIDELNTVAADITTDIEKYNLHLASEKLYHYIWHTFADTILEESKTALAGDDGPKKHSAQQLLLEILTTSLQLLHPFMPFITEEVWQEFPKELKDADLLMVSRWPRANTTT